MTEFERCKAELREWTTFCQGYAAANLHFNRHVDDRCYSEELALLNECRTPGDLVVHILTYVPWFARHKTMRERWNEFREEAYRHFFNRCMVQDHPVPCDPPSVIERLRFLMLNGEPK